MSDPATELLRRLRENVDARNPRPLALFSDFDGTLAPIAPTPAEAHILPQSREALRRLALAEGGRLLVGILSGRPLAELAEKLPLPGALLAGNHGLEIATPAGTFIHPQARLARPELDRLKTELEPELDRFPGAWIEDKGFGLAVHYRQLAPDLRDALASAVMDSVRGFSLSHLTRGRCVWELRPAIDWNKGKALGHMLEVAVAPPHTLTMYFGDDTTDEDAFRAVNERGGLSVLVREDQVESCSAHRLASPAEVADFLSQLALLYNE